MGHVNPTQAAAVVSRAGIAEGSRVVAGRHKAERRACAVERLRPQIVIVPVLSALLVIPDKDFS